MKNRNIKFFLLLCLILSFNSCGFDIINKSEINNFSIKQINTDGNKRIGQKIKNNLLPFSKKNSANNLVIDITSKKNKTIKEKNIKNEITKYQINLDINVSFKSLEDSSINILKNFSVSGDYSVGKIHSTSINNEKKLIDNLIENLSKMILNEMTLKLNDL